MVWELQFWKFGFQNLNTLKITILDFWKPKFWYFDIYNFVIFEFDILMVWRIWNFGIRNFKFEIWNFGLRNFDSLKDFRNSKLW